MNNSTSAPILRTKDLVKEFHTGGQTIRVLDQIDLSIDPHDYLSIRGPSGVGKTTLLHILGLIDNPSGGELFVEERNVLPLSDGERSEIRNQKFGFVFQFYHLISELTALENVLIPTMISDGPFKWIGARSDYRERGRELLQQVGLERRENHHPEQLSGGERQRVAIARALIMEPEVLYCDEPTGNLDRTTGQKVYDLLEKLRSEHQTALILATHDQQLSQRAEEEWIMEDGRLQPSAS